MCDIAGVYIADYKDNLVFEYPLTQEAPQFETVVQKIGQRNTGASPFIESKKTTAPVLKLGNHLLYHCNTKYLTVMLACKQKDEYADNADDSDDTSDAEDTDSDVSYESDSDTDEVSDDDSDSGSESDPDSGSDTGDENGTAEKSQNVVDKARVATINPIMPIAFLQQFITVMTEYFGDPLVAANIEANYDILCLLLSEMIEGGYPYSTDLNQLQDLVKFEGVLSRILGVAAAATGTPANMATGVSGNAISSQSLRQDENSIPWRCKAVKHSVNEFFVDITEHVHLTMSPSKSSHDVLPNNGSSAFYSTGSGPGIVTAKPLIARIFGAIDIDSRLSGVPDLQLILNTNGHNLGVPTFHECVQIDRWMSTESVLAFVPPDGKCNLASYEIDLTNMVQKNQVLRNTGIVFGDFKTGLGMQKNEFEITLRIGNLHTVKCIDSLSVEINTELHKSKVSTIRIVRQSYGDFQFSNSGKHKWIFEKNLPTGVNPVFRGAVVSDDEEAVLFPNRISLDYKYKGSLASGMKVTTLKVSNISGKKPYKGVKYLTQSGEHVLR